MAYPDTDLRNSTPVQDSDFGGQTAKEFGARAFRWVNSVLMFLEEAYLKIIYRSHGSLFITVQNAVAAGDVICFFPDRPISGARYWADRYVTGHTNVQIIGVALLPASAGATTQVVSYGIIPAAVSGLVSTSGSSFDVGLNPTTGRMRSAQTGDVILGRCDGQGNAMFDAHGEAV